MTDFNKLKTSNSQKLKNLRVDLHLLANSMQNVMIERTSLIASEAMRYIQSEMRRICKEIEDIEKELEK